MPWDIARYDKSGRRCSVDTSTRKKKYEHFNKWKPELCPVRHRLLLLLSSTHTVRSLVQQQQKLDESAGLNRVFFRRDRPCGSSRWHWDGGAAWERGAGGLGGLARERSVHGSAVGRKGVVGKGGGGHAA